DRRTTDLEEPEARFGARLRVRGAELAREPGDAQARLDVVLGEGDDERHEEDDREEDEDDSNPSARRRSRRFVHELPVEILPGRELGEARRELFPAAGDRAALGELALERRPRGAQASVVLGKRAAGALLDEEA